MFRRDRRCGGFGLGGFGGEGGQAGFAEQVEVEAHVHQAHARLNGAPVRDFVPVLIKREVRVTLANLTNRRPERGDDQQ